MGAPTRSDQRSNNQLRPLSGEPGVLSRADGSARFSHDKTEVLVAVYAPAEVKRARERLDAATIEVDSAMAGDDGATGSLWPSTGSSGGYLFWGDTYSLRACSVQTDRLP